jgi:hypothetical protein
LLLGASGDWAARTPFSATIAVTAEMVTAKTLRQKFNSLNSDTGEIRSGGFT